MTHYNCKACKTKVLMVNKQRHLQSKAHLKASGIIGDLANKALDFGNNLAKKFIKNGYNNQATKTMNEYGGWKIFKINVYRKPVVGALDTALNLISLGKFDDGKQAGGYDKFYHLGLFCVLGNERGAWANVICEKNEVIHIEKVSFNINSFATGDDVTPVVVSKRLTLKEMLDNAQKTLGDNYFYYDPWTNNCQVFCRALLSGSGLLTPKLDAFVYQPLEEVIKHIPGVSQKLATGITNLGGIFNNLLGKGKPKPKRGGDVYDPWRGRKPITQEEEEKMKQLLHVREARKRQNLNPEDTWKEFLNKYSNPEVMMGGRMAQTQVHSGDKMLDIEIPDLELDEDEYQEDPAWYDIIDNDGEPALQLRDTPVVRESSQMKNIKLHLLQQNATNAQKRGLQKIKDNRKRTDAIVRNARDDRNKYLDDRQKFGTDAFWKDFVDTTVDILDNVADVGSLIPIPAVNKASQALKVGTTIGKSMTGGKKRRTRKTKRVHFK